MPNVDPTQNAAPLETAAGVMDLQPEQLRQTRAQIASIVAEIAVASKTYQDQKTFFQFTIERLCEAMSAIGSAVWQCSSDGNWTLIAEHQIPDILLAQHNVKAYCAESATNAMFQSIADIEEKLKRLESIDLLGEVELQNSNGDDARTQPLQSDSSQPSDSHRILLQVLESERQPTLIPPSENPPPGRPPNNTPFCLVFAPVASDEESSLWLQAILQPVGGSTVYRGYLRFVVQIAELVSDFLKSFRLRKLSQEKLQVSTAESILLEIDDVRRTSNHESASPAGLSNEDAEAAIVTRAIMRFTQADEAFFVHRSVTKQLQFGPRGNGLRIADNSEAASVLRRFVSSYSQIDKARKPSFIDKDHDKAHSLLEVFGCRAVAWLPVWINPNDKTSTSFVALLLLWYEAETAFDQNQIESKLNSAAVTTRLGIQYAVASPIAQAVNELQTGRRYRGLVRRVLNSSKARVAILILFLAIACAVPVPMTITAPATLVPRQLHVMYAPSTGVVDQVLVRYGQTVTAGQPILQLKSDALENEYEALLAERIESEQRRRDIELQLLRSNELTTQQRSSLEGEVQTISVLERSQQEQLKLLQKQLDQLKVCSRIDGVVGTWQIESELNGKPVAFGQPLVTVYNPEADWAFEIALREHDAGHLLQQLQNEEPPKVLCRLDTLPLQLINVELETQNHQFVLHESSDGQSVVPIFAKVESHSIPQLTPGATATVEVVVGNQPILWVLTRDLALSVWEKIRLWI